MAGEGAAVIVALGLLGAVMEAKERQEAAHRERLKLENQKRTASELEAARRREATSFEETLREVIVLSGLYREVDVPDHIGAEWARHIRQKVDFWCLSCEKIRPFRAQGADTCPLVYRCVDCEVFEVACYLRFDPLTLKVQKVGQYPSVADLVVGVLAEYQRALPSRMRTELNRAVGLNAHGVGAGAFVYLRRVLEWLVDEAEKAASSTSSPSGAPGELRVADRIRRLRGYLPDALVDNNRIYGVLSRGIHSLTEEECSDIFGDVLRCTLAILHERQARAIFQQSQGVVRRH